MCSIPLPWCTGAAGAAIYWGGLLNYRPAAISVSSGNANAVTIHLCAQVLLGLLIATLAAQEQVTTQAVAAAALLQQSLLETTLMAQSVRLNTQAIMEGLDMNA